jgi:plastocyanin
MHPRLHRPLRQRAVLAVAVVSVGLLLCACTLAAQSSNPPAQPTLTPALVAPAPKAVAGAAPIPLAAPTPGGAAPTFVGAAAADADVPLGTRVPAPAAIVTITADRQFAPQLVTINVGQWIRWQNQSRNPHTVTGDPALIADKSLIMLPVGAQPFASAALNAGDSYFQRFDMPGDYQYVSLPLQTQMVGRVTVSG